MLRDIIEERLSYYDRNLQRELHNLEDYERAIEDTKTRIKRFEKSIETLKRVRVVEKLSEDYVLVDGERYVKER